MRRHGQLETETGTLSLAESQLALAALESMRAGGSQGVAVLRQLLRRVSPTLLRRVD